MKKKSAYQKLKDENLALKMDIHTLLYIGKSNFTTHEDTMAYLKIKMKWDLKFNSEKIMWEGSSNFKNK